MMWPFNDRMLLDVGRSPFLAISRIFVNIFIMLVSLNLSIF